MWQELSVNTRTAETRATAHTQEVAAVAYIHDLSSGPSFWFRKSTSSQLPQTIILWKCRVQEYNRTVYDHLVPEVHLVKLLIVIQSHCAVLIELCMFYKSPFDLVFYPSLLAVLCQHNLLLIDPLHGQSIKSSLLITPTQLLETVLPSEKLKGQANRNL